MVLFSCWTGSPGSAGTSSTASARPAASGGLRELITQRTIPWPADLILEATSERDPWAVMGIVRNRLAHGNPKVPTNPQITATLHLAHTLAVGLTLDLLGVSDTVLRASIAEDWWKVLR
jgi:hypothetical protein